MGTRAMGVRTEASISLTIAWNPSVPLDARDIPVVRNFLGAVKGMMRLPGRGVALSGPVSLLEAAFQNAVPVLDGSVVDGPEAVGMRERSTVTWAEGEREMIRQALIACRGNRTHAAKRLGIAVRTLRNRMHEHGLMDEHPRFAGPVPRALAETTV